MSNSKSSDNGCVWLIGIFFFFGAIVWLFGAALWLLQFVIPLVGTVLAIALIVNAWMGVRNNKTAAELAKRNRSELQDIALDTEYQLNAILASWDDVNTTMGVGTIYKDAFASGQATPELVELRGELTRARSVADKLRLQRETMDNNQLIDSISEADALWGSLTEKYNNARREQ